MSVLPPNASKIGVSESLYRSTRVREILVWPNPILSQPCEDVTEFDDELGQLVMDMCLTMASGNGVGLAAPQVGVNKNIITIGFPKHYALDNGSDYTGPTEYGNSFIDYKVMINPRILNTGERQWEHEEGCLSVPGYFEKRKRPSEITVEYQLPNERWDSVQLQGLEAFAVQHELDHLNGKLFIDDLSRLKKDRVKKKVKKALRDPLYPVAI